MNHEIDLQNYKIRTDLIDETKGIDQIEKLDKQEKNIDNIIINNIKINKRQAKIINKSEGRYITISFKDITDFNNKEKVKKIFSDELTNLLKELNLLNKSCLIIGLGNIKSTPDSLGPLSIDNIIITKHLYELGQLEEGFSIVSSFIPGVTGSTGIETSDLIKSIIDTIKPEFVIVIDALASSSIDRVNKTIQITDTGIHPGSGVGNSRKEISKNTLNIPVIAIGVPTVVDATIIVSDTIEYMQKHYVFNKKFQNNPMSKLTMSSNVNYLKEKIDITEKDKIELFGLLGYFSNDEIKKLVFEVLNPIGYNLMVTPKEIDFIIDKLADIIGNGINHTLHKNVN